MEGTSSTYSYAYDGTGRLSEVRKDGEPVASYAYDENGNRTTKTDASDATSATYDEQDRLLQRGDTSYAYMDNGELLSKTEAGGTTGYEYDALGNLLSVSLPDGREVEYVVDGRNRRVGKKVDGELERGFLYDGQLAPVAELDGSGNVISRFIYATKGNVPDYMVKGDQVYRIVSDHLGSPRLVVDASTGEVAQKMDCDEFGQVIHDSNPGFQPFGFAGGLYDADTKLVRFGARDYDAEAGRWTAKDPIRFSGGDANLYGYVFADPVNFVDPSGLWGFGLSYGGSVEAGSVSGSAGGSVQGAYGGFKDEESGWSDGLFGSIGGGGGTIVGGETGIGYPDDWQPGNTVAGAYAGVGPGVFYTNADCVDELAGSGDLYTLNVGVGLVKGSLQLGVSEDTWSINASPTIPYTGAGIGASASHYQANTWSTQAVSYLF